MSDFADAMVFPVTQDLAGLRALVTGSSRGLGAAIAERLIAGGATVVTTAREYPEPGTEIGTFVQGDVGSAAGAQAIVSKAVRALGGLDILVNNVARSNYNPEGSTATEDAAWLDTLEMSYLSAVRTINAAFESLRESESAAIVNITSAAALHYAKGYIPYSVAKNALITYSKYAAREFAPHGVRINAVTPGMMSTPGGKRATDAIHEATGLSAERIASGIPLGGPADPRDIADAVAHLVSPRSRWVTGANLVIDGGENS